MKKPSMTQRRYQAVIDFVKHQINIDLEDYRDETTKRFDGRRGFSINWKAMGRNDQYNMKELARKSGRFNLHDGGAWMMSVDCSLISV